jgi:hypothetical protein
LANRLLTGLRIVKKAFIPTALQRRLRKQATDLAGAAATEFYGGGEPPSGATEGKTYATRIDDSISSRSDDRFGFTGGSGGHTATLH